MAVSSKGITLLICVALGAFSATALNLPRVQDAISSYKNSINIANEYISAAVKKVLETQHVPAKVEFPEFQFERIPVSANLLLVDGLSSFEVKSVSTSLALQSMSVKIRVPSLEISGHLVDGNKNGPFRIQLQNAEISVLMGLIFDTKHPKTRSLYLDVNYDKMEAQFDVITENREQLSKVAGKVFVRQFIRFLKERFTKDVQMVVDQHLMTLNMERLVGGASHLQILRQQSEKEIGNANEYFDEVVKNVNSLVLSAGLDPVALPNQTKSFEEHFLWITWNADVGIYNGWFAGLSSLYRSADVTLDHEGTWIILFGEMAYEVLSFGYTGIAKFEGLGPIFDIKGTVRDMRMFLKVRLDATTFDPVIDSFEIIKVGDIHVEIEGLELIDWLINPVMNWVIDIIDGMIVNNLSDLIEDLLQQAVDNIGNGNRTEILRFVK